MEPQPPEFEGRQFETLADFRGKTLTGPVSFDHAKFQDGADFSDAVFEGPASFKWAVFNGEASFKDAVFRGRASFAGARFTNLAKFDHARFEARVSFRGARFSDDAAFSETTFQRRVRFEDVICAKELRFNRAWFVAGFHITGLRHAKVEMEGTYVGSEAILSGHPADRPTLYSLRGANLATLIVSDVDLAACRFANAHNLHRLRLADDCVLAPTPRGRSRRRVIAEEHLWRAERDFRSLPDFRRRGWRPPEVEIAGPSHFQTYYEPRAKKLSPQQIGSIYRDLRRGREAASDAPGAADFYYGEMEMRRLDSTRPLAERVILHVYWLIAGYGLRAARAALAFVVAVIGFALLLRWRGFETDPSFTRALLFSAESSSSLLRAPTKNGLTLTSAGEFMHLALRVIGPVLLALVILSVRGRVKR